MIAIDRKRVRHSFEQHAADYDRYACVQKTVVNRFVEGLRCLSSVPSRLLDIGAGTGMLLGELANLYPEAGLVGVDLAYDMGKAARARLEGGKGAGLLTADAELLPFANSSFDLVVSTSTFQWLDSLDAAFTEAFRVLRSGGTFCFSLFGEKTLFELRDAYRSASRAGGTGGESRSQAFFSMEDVNGALSRCGFGNIVAERELEIERHHDVPDLLKSLRRIGAGNPAPVSSPGLSERRVMLDMMNIYRDRYGDGGSIPATYEIFYARGRKP